VSEIVLKEVVKRLGFMPQPAAEVLLASEVVDIWSIDARSRLAGEYLLRGMSSNGRFVQRQVEAIDASPGGPRWIVSGGAYWRLGWADRTSQPIVQIALANDWVEAVRIAAEQTGQHTLDEVGVSALAAALQAGAGNTGSEIDWFARRTSCRALCAMLQERGRRVVADAWRLLGADPKYVVEALVVARLLRASGECTSPGLTEIAEAWEDAARSVGALTVEGDHIGAGARVLAAARSRLQLEPLFLRAIRCRRWQEAASVVLAECPYQIQLKARLDRLDEVLPSQRSGIATLFAQDLAEANEPDIAECFKLLAVDPFDADEAQWVFGRLRALLPVKRTAEDLSLLAGWEKLAAADRSGIDVGHVDDRDPVAMAWAASAARTAAEVDEDLPSATATGSESRRSGAKAESSVDEEDDGVVVLAEIGGVRDTASYKHVKAAFARVLGQRLPLTPVHDLDLRRSELVREFPHAERAISAILSDLRGRRFVRFRHTCLAGPPGTGKSRLVRRIAETFCVEEARFDASGAADNAFGGCPRHWHNGEPSFPVHSLIARGRADGIIMVDELDKAATARLNGNIAFALLPLLEVETARRYPDPYLQTPVDLSHISFFATVNDAAELPAAVRDRFRIVRIEAARAEHMPALVRSMIADVAEASGEDPQFFPDLNDGEAAIVETLWRGGSLRRLRDIVELILNRRETHPRN